MVSLAAVFAAPSLVARGAASHGGSFSTVLHLTEVAAAQHYNDVAPRGPSAGDTITGWNDIEEGGKRVGIDSGLCTAFSKAYLTCNVEVDLFGHGRLMFQGTYPFHPSSVFAYAVIGGTRDFADARGQALIKVENQTTTLIDVYLF
jgi:hypothetical protein